MIFKSLAIVCVSLLGIVDASSAQNVGNGALAAPINLGASTAAEGYLRGMADAERATGEADLLYAAAALRRRLAEAESLKKSA